jgi:hypothetical protein
MSVHILNSPNLIRIGELNFVVDVKRDRSKAYLYIEIILNTLKRDISNTQF